MHRNTMLGGAFAVAAIGVAAVAALVTREPPPAAPTAPAVTVTVVKTVVMPAPAPTPAPKATKPTCDDFALHGRHLQEAGSQDEAKRLTIATIRGWTPECRWEAFQLACETRCWDFDTDRIIAGAPPDEAKKLRTERLKRNRASLTAGEDVAKKVRKVVAHANAIKTSPRGANPVCLTRMRADFDEIEKLRKTVKDGLVAIPVGLVGFDSTLALAKSCLDCSDSRLMCVDMNEDMASNEEILTEWKAMNDRDALALGEKP